MKSADNFACLLLLHLADHAFKISKFLVSCLLVLPETQLLHAQLIDEVFNNSFLFVDLFNIALDLLLIIFDMARVMQRFRVAFR